MEAIVYLYYAMLYNLGTFRNATSTLLSAAVAAYFHPFGYVCLFPLVFNHSTISYMLGLIQLLNP